MAHKVLPFTSCYLLLATAAHTCQTRMDACIKNAVLNVQEDTVLKRI